MTGQSTPYVGRSLRRREDRKFLTGRGRYVDDIKLPGTLYLAILRSPHAHARIIGINLSAARAAAGVVWGRLDPDLVSNLSVSGTATYASSNHRRKRRDTPSE